MVPVLYSRFLLAIYCTDSSVCSRDKSPNFSPPTVPLGNRKFVYFYIYFCFVSKFICMIFFRFHIDLFFSRGYEKKYAMLSRELYLNDLVAWFRIYISELLASADIVRGVIIYKMLSSQVLRRVGFLYDPVFNINWLKILFKNRTRVTFRLPHILLIYFK